MVPSEKSPSGLLGRLRSAGLHPKKGLGQNFLCDPRILAFIADEAALEPDDVVLEVGTGPATLTRILCSRAGQIISIEIDASLAAFARQELTDFDNVAIIVGDALAGKDHLNPQLLAALESVPTWKLVANLPYVIATPLLLQLFARGESGPRLAVVTIQREVADRLRARPGERAYGPATVLLAFWATVEVLRELRPGAFVPAPKVSSTVLKIIPRPQALGKPAEFEGMSHWVSRLFSQRRKQVGGLLKKELGNTSAVEALQLIDIEGRERAGDLPPEAYLELARRFPPGRMS